jgi:hypothetical protein
MMLVFRVTKLMPTSYMPRDLPLDVRKTGEGKREVTMGSKNYKVAIVRYQQKWEHQNVLVSFLFQFNCLVLL